MKRFLPVLVLFLGLLLGLSSAADNEAPEATQPEATGIDFGADLLKRLVDIGFTRDQKSRAVDVLRNYRSDIRQICERLVETVDTAKCGEISEETADQRLEAIQTDLTAVNRRIERELLKIATNEQILRLKLRLKEEEKAKTEAARKAKS